MKNEIRTYEGEYNQPTWYFQWMAFFESLEGLPEWLKDELIEEELALNPQLPTSLASKSDGVLHVAGRAKK